MEKAIVLAVSAFSACFAVGLAAFAAAIGDSKVSSTALEGMTRQPEMAGELRSTMIIGMAFIEAVPILGIVIAFILVLM